MLNLAEDIQEHGLLGNQQIVVVYSESIKKYVVYEGNRLIRWWRILFEALLNICQKMTMIQWSLNISNI